MHKRLTLLVSLYVSLLTATSVFSETPFAPQHDPIAMGVTKLSPYFSVELSDSYFQPRLLKVFHHDKGNKSLIGVTKISEHASRQNGYAISEDGRTLLYFHQNLPSEKDISKPSGLYEYRHNREGNEEDDRIRQMQVANIGYLPAQVPENTIVFTKMVKKTTTLIVDATVYILDTKGNVRRVWPP